MESLTSQRIKSHMRGAQRKSWQDMSFCLPCFKDEVLAPTIALLVNDERIDVETYFLGLVAEHPVPNRRDPNFCARTDRQAVA